MNKIAVKGKLRAYLQWPIFLSLLLVAATVVEFFVNYKAGVVMAFFLVIYLVMGIIIYQYLKPTAISELMSFAMAYGQVQQNLLYDMELPYGVIDHQGKLLWSNGLLTELIGEKGENHSIWQFFPDIKPGKIKELEERAEIEVHYKERFLKAHLCKVDLGQFAQENPVLDLESNQEGLYGMYLVDETELYNCRREIHEQKLVCGMIVVDNYEEALNSTEDVRRSLLAALVDRKITKYMQNYDAILNKMEKDKYTFVVRQKYIPMMQSTKFSLLDEVREINIGNQMAVTICIGVGINANSYGQSADWARSAIDLALGRGGDQAVLKDRDKISYYGGKTKQVEKSTRVRARVKAHALKQLIEGKEQVVIMGHKIGDVDSFGAAIGVYRVARTLNKKAHIVINDITTSVRPIMANFLNNSDYEPDMFLTSEAAFEVVDMNTALVVVDVNRPSYTEGPELFAKTKTVVVLDHHRQSSESVENAVLSYIEPYASSACEMVAEILQYIADGIKLRPAEADAMYAGLMIDTNNFLTKTGVRTFEAAAFLKKSGADVTRVRMAFREDFDTYRVRAESVRNAFMYQGTAMSVCDAHGVDSPTVVGAQVANELMNITDVKASFVFTSIKGTIYISARSLEGGPINVQLVMERLGGGGHSTVAGAQLKETTTEDAIDQVKSILRNMRMEGEY